MKFLKFISQDLNANKHNTKGIILVVCFRIANYNHQNTSKKLLFFPYIILYKITFEWIMGIEIPYQTTIGEGLKIFHGTGLVINKNTIIGKNVTLRQNTTIGNSSSGGKSPVIEDNVNIGANCVIIGDITVGQNCIIGAGSIVVKSIASNTVAVGNPARVIRVNNKDI